MDIKAVPNLRNKKMKIILKKKFEEFIVLYNKKYSDDEEKVKNI